MRAYFLGAIVVDDAAPEQVADVRRERVDRPLVAVEGKGVITTILKPEVVVERLLDLVRLVLEAPCRGSSARHDVVRKPRSVPASVG